MSNPENNNKSYLAYLNYGFQLLGGAAVGIWLGHWADKKLSVKIPLLIWILPMIIIVLLLIRLIKEFTGKRK